MPAPSIDKPVITSSVVFGDSLSDEQRKYNEYIFFCIPFKWFLYHSDYSNFTNGHTWAYIFANILNNILKENSIWSTQEKSVYFKNVAEGGATTYDYRNIKSFFKHPKGFILSFFLGNIQKQAEKIKKEKKMLDPHTLGIIFAGANDLVTLGYDDPEGVERTIQGVIKTIETLTDKNDDSNYLNHLLLVGLPDISETPRFAHKSVKEKEKMKLACQQYNQKLQELTNEYQYVNFDLCAVYKYAHINRFLDLEDVKKIEKAIVVTGEGKNRKIYFINNGKFLIKSDNKLTVDISLSKNQMEFFSKDEEIIRNDANGNKLDKFVNRVTKKAKLNIDIKMIGIEPILDEILQNPEVHGFTAGCAVYYLPKNEGQEIDELLRSKNITISNAVIIKETNAGFFSYLIKNEILITEQEKPVQIKFELSEENQSHLRKKLKKPIFENGMIKLAGMEDIHDICIIDVIKSIVENFKSSFHKEIELTNISKSVLESIKKGYLNRDTIFWDDLHPARRLHELLALKTTEFIKNQYSLKNPPNYRDDSAMGVKAKLVQSKYAEAPGNLDSSRSLIRSRGC